MDIAVVGAGYVGLVSAACLAKLGHTVICLDVDPVRVARLQRGDVPLSEPDLPALVADGLASGRLTFTRRAADIADASLAIVAVGTLDADGEWTPALVRAAVLEIAAAAGAPRAIVVRSTLLPGTAVRLAEELRRFPGVELALNPEFTREGSAVRDFFGPDRVVIGADGERGHAVRQLRRLYEPLGAPIVVTDLTSAETIKVASNVFLAAKVAFANELARVCEATGANVHDVVDGIGLDRRIGRAFLSPGPGFGGSCLPNQARALPALAVRAGVDAPMIGAIAPSNDAQATWLLDLAERAIGRRLAGRRLAVLGMTFKAGTDDIRESAALRVVTGLVARGARVSVYDPLATERATSWLAAQAVAADAAATPLEAAAGADAVVIATEWPEFRTLDWGELARAMRGDVVVDARALAPPARLAAAGLRVVGVVEPPRRLDGLDGTGRQPRPATPAERAAVLAGRVATADGPAGDGADAVAEHALSRI